jgi:hypothetical protein
MFAYMTVANGHAQKRTKQPSTCQLFVKWTKSRFQIPARRKTADSRLGTQGSDCMGVISG